ncbi:unnamed protein product, partial [Sphagnum jensenii]
VRGTNLGSWLVLESWMAPRPWDENGCDKGNDAGSYHLEQCLGDRAKAVMENHWSSFITESDFAEMSRHGKSYSTNNFYNIYTDGSKTKVQTSAAFTIYKNYCETHFENYRFNDNCSVENALNFIKKTHNLWLVLESWMAPRPWDENGCDKGNDGGSYLLEKCLGDRAKAVMENHWSSFITESDFAEMSRHGINLVRIPVGWWQIYDPQGGAERTLLNSKITPKNYTTGGLAYIDKAFEWGLKYGIAILLDMHAAPGSQNGWYHSSPAVLGQ